MTERWPATPIQFPQTPIRDPILIPSSSADRQPSSDDGCVSWRKRNGQVQPNLIELHSFDDQWLPPWPFYDPHSRTQCLLGVGRRLLVLTSNLATLENAVLKLLRRNSRQKSELLCKIFRAQFSAALYICIFKCRWIEFRFFVLLARLTWHHWRNVHQILLLIPLNVLLLNWHKSEFRKWGAYCSNQSELSIGLDGYRFSHWDQHLVAMKMLLICQQPKHVRNCCLETPKSGS